MTRAAGAAWLFTTTTAVYVLDRATKLMAVRVLEGRPPIQLAPGVRLAFTTNPGGAFSIGGGTPWLFVGATIVVSAVIVVTAWRHTSVLTAASLGAVLGGALGNLTDRVLRAPDLRGQVIDFIDVGRWPVFNMADTAIVIGAILLAWSGSRSRREPGPEAGSDGA
ncbi:MAG: signal peptidase II [Actinobacteria bacterium]|nr:signal peptidase II [Actinomycetota bacterium]